MSQETPFFSIAIPAFKISFFEECLQSVLSQTFQDFEVIIINDASPDPLEDIIAKYPDERVIYKKNDVGYGGYHVIDNWMACLKLAKGNYFMCIGDDDRLLPDCLQKYSSLIRQYPNFKIYHAGTQFINENSEIVSIQEPRPPKESVWSIVWHQWFKHRTILIGDYLFQTDFLRNQGGFVWFPYAWGSDSCTVYHIAACGGGIANMQDFAFQYRINNQSISLSRSLNKQKLIACSQAKEWVKNFLANSPSNPNDIFYWKDLCRGFNDYYDSLYKSLITGDIKANHSIKNIVYWLRHGKKYQLSIPSVILCILHGFH